MAKQEFSILFSGQSNEIKQNFTAYLERNGIKVYFSTRNGEDIVQMIADVRPKVVVLDAFLNGTDAISVKNNCKNLIHRPQLFLAMQSCDNDGIKQCLINAGFGYCFLKPVSCEYILDIAQRLVETECNDSRFNTECEVSKVLRTMGFKVHFKGYRLLVQSIIMGVENPQAVTLVTKRLYPELACINNTTASRVERAMRHAIEEAWEHGNMAVMNGYFGYTLDNMRAKPTNREFIAVVSDRIRLDMKKRKLI